MRSTFSALTQSKYFTPSFNSAIFDGPIRIYFSQFHESYALKVYFMIQDQLAELLKTAKEIAKKDGLNIMVMIYPTPENFINSFESEAQTKNLIASEDFNETRVIGVRGPLDDAALADIKNEIQNTFFKWESIQLNEPLNLSPAQSPSL